MGNISGFGCKTTVYARQITSWRGVGGGFEKTLEVATRASANCDEWRPYLYPGSLKVLGRLVPPYNLCVNQAALSSGVHEPWRHLR